MQPIYFSACDISDDAGNRELFERLSDLTSRGCDQSTLERLDPYVRRSQRPDSGCIRFDNSNTGSEIGCASAPPGREQSISKRYKSNARRPDSVALWSCRDKVSAIFARPAAS